MTATPRWPRTRKKAFLDTLRKTGSPSAAAREAGVPLHKAYEKRDKDKSFRKLWASCEDEALDDLEAELRRRAIEGTEKPVYYAGKKCGTIKSFNDNLAMFLLKARRGTVFGEGSGAHEGEGGEGDPHETLFEKLAAMTSAKAKQDKAK